MTVKLIIDEDDVLTKLSLPNLPEIVSAIESALVSAHVHLQSVYGSTFELKNSQVDYFVPDADWFPTLIGDVFRLRLSKAFVHSGSISLAYGLTRKEILSDPILLPTEDYTVDLEKGIVKLDWEDYDKKWVKVTYNAGFDASHKAPDWLKEACTTCVAGMLQTTTINGADASVLSKTREDALKTAGSLIEPYMRGGTASQCRPVM